MSYIYLNDNPCENSTSFAERVEVSSAASFADIPASVLSRLTNFAEDRFCNDKETESCQDFQSGTTCELLTGNRGHRESISSRRDSRATTSLRRAKRLESMDRNLPSSLRFAESSLKFDLNSYSWKTAEILWDEDLPESSVNLPGWGMILDGVVWEPATSEPTTKGFGHGLCATPMTGNERWNGTLQEGGGSLNKWRETWLGRQWINPGFWEEIMCWPIGWTDLQQLEQVKFQQWLTLHGQS